MHATPARPDAAPAHPADFTGTHAGSAEKTAAIAAPAAAAASMHPQSLLTPAVTRVIAWHAQRLNARQDRAST